MKSVGEVMAIGRSFEEALQKALRMVDTRRVDLGGENLETFARTHARAHSRRGGSIAPGLHHRAGGGPSHIDAWFLQRIGRIVDIEGRLRVGVRRTAAGGKKAGFRTRRSRPAEYLSRKSERSARPPASPPA